jgi:hypothetical protein
VLFEVEVVEGFLVRPIPEVVFLFFYNPTAESIAEVVFTAIELVFPVFGVLGFV